MSTEITDINEYTQCQCSWANHTIHWRLTTWDGEPELDLEVLLTPAASMWKRIKLAVCYVFGLKLERPHFDECEVRPGDADKLVSLLMQYQLLHRKWQKKTTLQPERKFRCTNCSGDHVMTSAECLEQEEARFVYPFIAKHRLEHKCAAFSTSCQEEWKIALQAKEKFKEHKYRYEA